MHDAPGVRVEQNVRVRALTPGKRSREIDVLINGTLSGYPMRVAIECKNEKEIVGAPKIDAFVGKLLDIGIPPQHGVYVAVRGFTRGAIARAKFAGIRTLVLTGLDESRLEAVVQDAVQAVVFLWAIATNWSIVNNVSADLDRPEELALFVDEKGALSRTSAGVRGSTALFRIGSARMTFGFRCRGAGTKSWLASAKIRTTFAQRSKSMVSYSHSLAHSSNTS
jgi:Restriction endonuclease